MAPSAHSYNALLASTADPSPCGLRLPVPPRRGALDARWAGVAARPVRSSILLAGSMLVLAGCAGAFVTPDANSASPLDADHGLVDARDLDAGEGSSDAGEHAADAEVGGSEPDAAPPSACGVQYGATIQLVDRQVVRDDPVEAQLEVPAGHAITGLGLRVNSGNVKTLRVRSQAVLLEGALGPPAELRAGVEPDGSLEASVDLPACYVLVGVAARVHDDNVATLVLWGTPLSPDGSLGAPEIFRGGSEPDGAIELEYLAPGWRVLTGVGFRASDDSLSGLRVVTDAWQL